MLKRINPNSIIFSDRWRGYRGSEAHFNSHLTVNNSIEFVNRTNNAHTNTVEGNWSSIKQSIPKGHRTKDFVDAYLVKYMIKRNEEGDLFINLLKHLF